MAPIHIHGVGFLSCAAPLNAVYKDKAVYCKVCPSHKVEVELENL